MNSRAVTYLSRISTKISFLCTPLFWPPAPTGFCTDEDGAVFVLSAWRQAWVAQGGKKAAGGAGNTVHRSKMV